MPADLLSHNIATHGHVWRPANPIKLSDSSGSSAALKQLLKFTGELAEKVMQSIEIVQRMKQCSENEATICMIKLLSRSI